MADTCKLNIQRLSKVYFNQVFRTSTDKPGFIHFNLGSQLDTYELRQIMVDLKKELSTLAEKQFHKTLKYQWLARFDQQENTRYHLDNAQNPSFLMLGYEPSDIESRLSFADYVKFSKDKGFSAADFFERYNPLFNDLSDVLSPYIISISNFDHRAFNIVLINNTNASSSMETLGVLHKAEILKPDRHKSRVVNSMMLNLIDPADDDTSAVDENYFLNTDKISR